MCWTVSNSGAVTLALHAERNTVFPELPRFGLRLFLPKEMARVSYFGMGPMESYCDKHHAASHDYFSSTIWQQHEDYIRPQENGSHYDCDYVQQTSKSRNFCKLIGAMLTLARRVTPLSVT